MKSKSAHVGFSSLCVLISDGRLASLAALNSLKFKSPTIKPKGSRNFQTEGVKLCECWLGRDALKHSKTAALFLYWDGNIQTIIDAELF